MILKRVLVENSINANIAIFRKFYYWCLLTFTS